ncbi:MAG: 3-hydroxyacyl-ACP dehydratase FabZ [Pseudomonadales bacterium]|nr:3-hydroxyacyl-ACP dehydratase FabZ [Pseudomonadales bacterium]
MMDIAEIQEYLPHRYPFLFIDRVTEIELGKYLCGYKNVSINEPFFQGHFPQKPIMPGVLIVEALAQACGVLGFKTIGKSPEGGTIYVLVGTDKMRFRRPVIPGDQLKLEVSVLKEKRGIWKFDCKASVDGEIVTRVELTVAESKV